jgi:hypothetical protein
MSIYIDFISLMSQHKLILYIKDANHLTQYDKIIEINQSFFKSLSSWSLDYLLQF